MLEEQIAERLRQLADQVGRLETYEMPTPIAARYTTTAGQSLTTATVAVVNFDTKTFDGAAIVTTGAAWKCTARVAGYYAVSAAILYASSTAWGAGKAATLELYKNGVAQATLDRKDHLPSGSAIFMQLHGADTIYLAAGDSFDIRTQQNTGGALALTTLAGFCYVAIHKL